MSYFYSLGNVDGMFVYCVLTDLGITIFGRGTSYWTHLLVTQIAWVPTVETGHWSLRTDQVWHIRELYFRLVFIDVSFYVAELNCLTEAIDCQYDTTLNNFLSPKRPTFSSMKMFLGSDPTQPIRTFMCSITKTPPNISDIKAGSAPHEHFLQNSI